MKIAYLLKIICKNKEWIFSGIGISVFGVVINFIWPAIDNVYCSQKETPQVINDNASTVNNTFNEKTNYTHNQFKGDQKNIHIEGNGGQQNISLGDVKEQIGTKIVQAPSYRDAIVVRGENDDAAIPVADKLENNNLNQAINLFGRLMNGENIEPQEAAKKMFSEPIFINSGTEVSVLESTNGITGFAKVKILEGAHKNKEGWVPLKLIKEEKRLVSNQ